MTGYNFPLKHKFRALEEGLFDYARHGSKELMSREVYYVTDDGLNEAEKKMIQDKHKDYLGCTNTIGLKT